MCEHCNETPHTCHNHNHESGCSHGTNKNIVAKVIIAFLLFLVATFLKDFQEVKLILFLIAYLLAGGDVLLSAMKNIIRGKVFDENFLMGIATLGAIVLGEYPEAVMVMVLYQTGEYFQHRAVEKSKKSITELMDIRPDYANIESNGQLIHQAPEKISIGDIIVVQAGEKIPLDGVIIDGQASVDTSALTGESVPRNLNAGDDAISGCININGLLKIKVTKTFGDSTVSKILELVEHASSKKAKAENFITKFARYYTPIVVLFALILAIVPPILTGMEFNIWIERALTFLVISCPCALVISIPLSFFAGIGGASNAGILIKGSCYIESLANTETVVFDKTGTLTEGVFKVTEIVPASEKVSEFELLKIAVYAENYSNHPIALSLKTAFTETVDTSAIKDISEIAGKGIRANIYNHEVFVGNDKLMKEFNISYSDIEADGSVIYVVRDRQYLGYIVISDKIKDDAKIVIDNLHKMKIKTVMLTGDSKKAADITASILGIEDVQSQLLPADKVMKLEELIQNKRVNSSIIFVGDGINDAPVLTRADVGIAMGGLGSDAAIEAADAVIMDDKPSKIANAISISKKTMAIVKQNILFTISVKVIFLLLGAIGMMTMWGAVFADVGVAFLAVLNALRALKN